MGRVEGGRDRGTNDMETRRHRENVTRTAYRQSDRDRETNRVRQSDRDRHVAADVARCISMVLPTLRQHAATLTLITV